MKNLILVLLLFALYSCNNTNVDTQKEGEKLMQISREWSESAASDDIEKTLSYWSDDAVFFSAERPTVTGKKELRQMVEGLSKAPGFKISWEPISASVSKSGDMAYLIEKNTFTINDSVGNPQTTYGRSVTIWKKDNNGEWKNAVEIGVDGLK
jgi:ketosteroid isomerase-like protein